MNPTALWVNRANLTQDSASGKARELWKVIQTVWLNISSNVFHTLVEFMPCQVITVLQTKEHLNIIKQIS